MTRPFRIGKHKVSQEEFDQEVSRLFKAGLPIGQIATRLRRDRTTVWRSMQRMKTEDPAAAEQAKTERQYYKETSDEFRQEPIIKEWIEDMKARRVGKWAGMVNQIKAICDDLGIFPDQLDLDWGKKWLALKSTIPLDELRGRKIAARGFFKAQGTTDYDLTQAGFDAKHYAVGKWKHVKMTEKEIRDVEVELEKNPMQEPLFVFKFGIETCRTLEPIWNLRGDQFYEIALEGREPLYAANLFRKKTEKSGAAFKIAYVSKGTYELAKKLSAKNGGTVMNGYTPDQIREVLKAAYRFAGVTNEYFFMHAIHALRHSGAQRWLEKTHFNRAVVAELGGWEAEKTLEDHYGGVPIDVIRGYAAIL